MEIYSIGFTQSSAEHFFRRLRDARIERLLDVRLNNVSQLAGFAKRDDLAYFTRELVGASYEHEPMLAPTQELLDYARSGSRSWPEFERRFLDLMRERRIEHHLDRASFERRTALLCSEATPEHCHRSLVLKYLASKWPDVTSEHL